MICRPARPWIAAFLSVALIAAPFAAGAAPAQQPAPAEHAAAHAHHEADSSHHAAHGTAGSELAGGCEQHQSCLGLCCAACTHCTPAVLIAPAMFPGAGSDFIPFRARLAGRLASAPPGPPPRA
jgi:hypothetical protein